jgi:uncharacterized protein (DUF2141 family)
VITVTSLVWVWRGEAAGAWHFVTVPDEQSGEIRAAAFESPRGFRSVRVEATINGVTWRTSVFPLNGGGYLLPVKAKVRRDAGIAAGDSVTVELIVG